MLEGKVISHFKWYDTKSQTRTIVSNIEIKLQFPCVVLAQYEHCIGVKCLKCIDKSKFEYIPSDWPSLTWWVDGLGTPPAVPEVWGQSSPGKTRDILDTSAGMTYLQDKQKVNILHTSLV